MHNFVLKNGTPDGRNPADHLGSINPMNNGISTTNPSKWMAHLMTLKKADGCSEGAKLGAY